jgi:hypothetical protein
MSFFCWNASFQNGVKQDDALLQMLFKFTLEYATRKVQEDRQELNGAYHHLACVDAVNLLGENTNITRKHTPKLDASKEVGPEVTAEETN